jgi:hypothetical protein
MRVITILCLFIAICNAGWPLDSVLIRGQTCIDISWTPDEKNVKNDWYAYYGRNCTGADSIYKQCDFIAGKTYRGIAYSYGGEDPWFTFLAKLAAGKLVGSHLCQYNLYGDPSDTIAGTDCTGYICFIWNVSRQSTTGMLGNSSYKKIDNTNAFPGDIIIKKGSGSNHAVLIVENDDPTQCVIWEASSVVNSCRERIIDLTDSYWTSSTILRNPAINTISSKSYQNRKSEHISIQLLANKNHEIYVPELIGSCIVDIYSLDGKILVTKKIYPNTSYSIENLIQQKKNCVVIVSITSKVYQVTQMVVLP